MSTGQQPPGRDSSGPRNVDVAPWPRWVRYAILAIVVPAFGIGLIVYFYDRGILPIAGPFVAVLLVPMIFLVRATWLRSRVTRLSRAAVAQLQTVSAMITAERSAPPQRRATGGSDDVLAAASERVESVLQQFAWGRDADGVLFAEDLTELAERWSSAAPLTVELGRALTTTRNLSEALRKAHAFAQRPPRR